MSTTTQEPHNTMPVGRPEATTDMPETAAGRDELLRAVAQRLTLVQRVVKLAAKQLIAEHQISPEAARVGVGQFHALSELSKTDRLMAGELADRCHVSEPTVSKMLKSLEASGYVERRTDPANRRVVWVSITPAGRETRDRLFGHFQTALARVLDGLDDTQLGDLLRALGHLDQLLDGLEAKR